MSTLLDDTLTEFEIFSELELEDSFKLSDLEEDILEKSKKYRADLYLDPTELAEKRMTLLEVTTEERVAIEAAALSVVEYAATGNVTRTAMDIIDSVTSDEKRCVRLLNVVLPLSRSMSTKGFQNGGT